MSKTVSFKTAVKAKEKGFNKPCDQYIFSHNTAGIITQCDFIEDTYVNFFEDGQDSGKVTAPTQTELEDWLRTEYNVHICKNIRRNSGILFHEMTAKRYVLGVVTIIVYIISNQNYKKGLETMLLTVLGKI
jgi:hypothetical protein